MASKACSVCTKERVPYKCPQCRAPYCVALRDPVTRGNDEPPRALLSVAQKQRLRTSAPLLQLLKSKRLRSQIEAIDDDPNKLQILRKVRENNSEFEDVVQLILNAIH